MRDLDLVFACALRRDSRFETVARFQHEVLDLRAARIGHDHPVLRRLPADHEPVLLARLQIDSEHLLIVERVEFRNHRAKLDLSSVGTHQFLGVHQPRRRGADHLGPGALLVVVNGLDPVVARGAGRDGVVVVFRGVAHAPDFERPVLVRVVDQRCPRRAAVGGPFDPVAVVAIDWAC